LIVADVTVPLSRTYTVHREVFDRVVLREPTFRDIYMDGLGEPEELQPVGNGGVMVVTDYAAVARYVERLAVKPTAECLMDLSAADSRRLKKAVCGFFRETDEGKKSPDTSSSGSVSTANASSE
jgi:hypothetical protein